MSRRLPIPPLYAKPGEQIRQFKVGEIVSDRLGQKYEIRQVYNQFCFRVQALTAGAGGLVPIGPPFTMGRSDIKP